MVIIKPYCEFKKGKLYQGDCLEIMNSLPENSIDLVFADPPYNIGKASWDKIDNYHIWCEKWIKACCRVLKSNGAFWVSHSNPEELITISMMIKEKGMSRINWITWDKYNCNHSQKGFLDGYTILTANRSFHQMAEYLIYHTDEGEWTRQCDKKRGFIFEPIRKYLVDEKNKSGFHDKEMRSYLGVSLKGGGLLSHYWGRVQWSLPTQEHYTKLGELFNSRGGGNYLRREYEDLRKEYEDLRYTFNNPGKMSSVWSIPPTSSSWHITPKPDELLKRIITTTSNLGDLIFEPFGGSIPGGRVAAKNERRWIAIEKDLKYCEEAKKQYIQEVETYKQLF